MAIPIRIEGQTSELCISQMGNEALIVERQFTEIILTPGQEPQPAKTLYSFLEKNALVVLGDPGAGKTTSFEQAARNEAGAIYVTVRDFLTLNIQRYQNKILFLDALDEIRGRTNDGRTVIDQLRSRLDELGCPSFRLSCRAADWYGSTDAQKLADVSPDKTLTVLQIEPLGETEIAQIVSERGIDHKKFVDEAKSRDVYSLLENPQTLLMLLDVVRQGKWPDSRAELYRRAVEVLIKENNEEHRRFPQTKIAPVDLIKTAGYLSAIILCGGFEGVAIDESAEGNSYISIKTLGWPIENLSETVRRRLFRTQSSDRVVLVHRIVAEYLAAKYLSERIHEGLPLKRVLSLITGYDGGSLADLRGLFAWLACLSPQHDTKMIRIDPLGIVLYGDASLLPPANKRLLIESLVIVANENPWFRSGGYSSKPFGALASSEMELIFRTVLEDRSQHPVAVSCVIDAIRHGHPLPSLGDMLLAIVRDDSRPEFLREDALEAFMRICKDRTTDLLALLNDIHNSRTQDQNCELRANLLRSLYPNIIGPSDIVQYIVQEPESYIGDYSMWLRYELCKATQVRDIPILLDMVAANKVEIDRRRRHSYQEFVGKLLIEGLTNHGEQVSPSRLYNWLGVTLDRHRMGVLEYEDKQVVRNWLEAHPEIVMSLFEHWLSIVPIDKLSFEIIRLRERLQRIDYPVGFGNWLIQLSVAQKNPTIANFLFREGVQFRTHLNRSDAPSLEELFHFVDENPQFQETWQKELSCDIEEWRWDNIQSAAKHRQKREFESSERIHWLMEHLDKVRSGTHIGAMNFYAQVYFGRFSDIDRNLEPRERIVSITNVECADAIIDGLVAGLHRANPENPTPAMIAETNAKARRYNYGFAVLAGMDILSNRTLEDALSLPDHVLGSALAYHYAMGQGEEQKWVKAILQERVDIASIVLETFWRIHLDYKSDHIDGLYALPRNEEMALIAQRVALPILHDYPNCKDKHLKNFLWAALLFAVKNELLKLARNTLYRRNAVRGAQRTLWYGTAFILNPEEYGAKLRKYIGKDRMKAEALLSFLCPSWPTERHLKVPELSVQMIGILVSICGKILLYENNERSEDEKEWEYRDHRGTLINMINHISSFTDDEAMQTLHSLYEQKSLIALRDAMAHALEIQKRKRRELLFNYPSGDQVIDTIMGGPPANPADLQALVTDYLLQLREDISHGSTDGYKAYWNVDSHGRILSPCPEETCRDRLLERLKYLLASYGLAAEPEGHYARDKRADIKVMLGSTFNIPIEIKRHYHSKLWTAPKDQLQKLYAQDPGSGGRGIYLVIWFGIARGRKIPTPPPGIQMPSDHRQLEIALKKTIPDKYQTLIEFIVIDCSGQ